MKIGVPKESKNHEYRVGLTPDSVAQLVGAGHAVAVESGAGAGAGFDDELYKSRGASIVADAEAIFTRAEMVVKVKEPQAPERAMLQPGQILFCYLHLAPDPEQTHDLLERQVSAVAFETVTDANGGLPLLTPMSEIAGKLSVQAGARCLERVVGGRGVLLGGVPGVVPAKVVIVGGGVVGSNATEIAVGMGARVVVLDRSLPALRRLHERFGARIECVYSTEQTLTEHLQNADLVVGAVLIPGASAPKLIRRSMLGAMLPGSVVVDVAIDQGGCLETAHATTYADPTYVIDDIVHYCVANMPGGVPRTATIALNNSILPHALRLAEHGLDALRRDPHLAQGLNVHAGKVTYSAVAEALDLPYVSAEECLG